MSLEADPSPWRARWVRFARAAAPRAEQLRSLLHRRAQDFMLASAALYLLMQVFYIQRVPLVSDELDGAFDVHRLLRQQPYVDYQPYKPVLGYYLQLPFLATAPDVWSGIFRTKLAMAVINTCAMVALAWQCARLYSRGAAAVALVFFALMTNWVDRSSELRVDTLTTLVGAFSLLALLRRRAALAGVLCALSFLTSQKGAYYAVASVVALLSVATWPAQRSRALRGLAGFAAAYVVVLGAYFAWFIAAASVESTVRATVTGRTDIVFGELYEDIRYFWWQTLRRNAAFFTLAVGGLVVLGARLGALGKGPRHARDVVLFVYASVLGILCIWHKQPWPYFFVMLVPTAFVLQVVALQYLLAALPRVLRAVTRAELAAAMFATGVWVAASAFVSPLVHYGKVLAYHDGAYQREMIRVASRLLAPTETYFAGIDVLYDRRQAFVSFARLSRPRRLELQRADRVRLAKLLHTWRAAPPKLLIRNNRFPAMPKPLAAFIRSQYKRFHGSIELYAPSFPAGKSAQTLAYAGSYRVDSESKKPVEINGQRRRKGQTVRLAPGKVRIRSGRPGRLVLLAPEVERYLRPEFAKHQEFNGVAYRR